MYTSVPLSVISTTDLFIVETQGNVTSRGLEGQVWIFIGIIDFQEGVFQVVSDLLLAFRASHPQKQDNASSQRDLTDAQANDTRCGDVVLMLGQRRRRLVNFRIKSLQRVVSAAALLGILTGSPRCLPVQHYSMNELIN